MRKGKSIIGKDILSLDDGVKMDKVSDVVVDPAGRRMVALVVHEGGFMSSSQVVPTDEVSSYGKDAVVVRSRASVISVSDHAELRGLVEHEEKVLGKKVFTTSGDDQGAIADIYFDEATAAVMGYEVSGGLIGDASKGTSYLGTDEIVTMGSDVIYVRPETAEKLEGQVGGVQGALQGAGAKIGEATAAQTPEEALIGKRTGSDVETDSGSVIVPKGRRIRPEDVTAAKEAGKLPALTSSAAMAGAEEAGAGAKDALGAAGDTAGRLWDQFTAKVGEMTDSTGKRVDEEQTKKRLTEISDAVGRPVTKVILDREDSVVLNLGDIITHQAIQRSYESGGLDSLLGSVYKGAVEFSKEEMRAPAEAEAEATVEKASGGAVIVDELETKVATAEQERADEKDRKKREAESDREQREDERGERESARAAEKEAREAEQAAADREAREAEEAAAEPASSSSARTTSPKKVR